MISKTYLCPLTFVSRLLELIDIFFGIKVKNLKLMKWSYNSLHYVIIKSRIVSMFENGVQSLLNTFLFVSVLRFSPNLISLKYRCPYYYFFAELTHVYLTKVISS